MLQNPISRIDEIRMDAAMIAQWEKYRKQYKYAADLKFDDVCDAVLSLLKGAL